MAVQRSLEGHGCVAGDHTVRKQVPPRNHSNKEGVPVVVLPNMGLEQLGWLFLCFLKAKREEDRGHVKILAIQMGVQIISSKWGERSPY